MPQNIALLHRHDLAVIQMKVTSANRRTSHLQDDIVILSDVRYGSINHPDILRAEPSESPHCGSVTPTLVCSLDRNCGWIMVWDTRRSVRHIMKQDLAVDEWWGVNAP